MMLAITALRAAKAVVDFDDAHDYKIPKTYKELGPGPKTGVCSTLTELPATTKLVMVPPSDFLTSIDFD